MAQHIGLLLFGTFAILLLLKVPVSFSLGISSLICLFVLDIPLVVVGQRMFNALNSFPIMAIPFFILSGNLMIEGGLSKKIVNFAMSLLSRIRGGLAMAAVLACTIFGALSGSGPATVLSIGGMIYPEMVSRGYDEEEMAGLITVSGTLGPIIPPSIVIVFFGTVTSVSITRLFAGSLAPASSLRHFFSRSHTLKPFGTNGPSAKRTIRSLAYGRASRNPSGLCSCR